MASIEVEEPRAGSIRYKNPDGSWRMSSPGDMSYSIVQFLFTEWWDGSKWVKREEE